MWHVTESGKHQILPLKAGDSVIILGKKKKTELYEIETMYGEKGLFPVELVDLGKVQLRCAAGCVNLLHSLRGH
jgi:hypothetical protein